ncbi:MAG: hypothetical protein KH358_00745 [Odoribacter splanchnicus]|nr:hypothetical protein [Odoribacter splanchnicus]
MNNELLTAGNLYGSLINDIGNILVEARGKICREINSVMVDAYWNIGKYIVEYEQKGEERAEYGSNLLNRLSKDLTRLYEYLAPSIYSYPYWRLKSNIRFYKGVFCLFGHPL